MSIDIVDDLHAAEDRIGVLEQALTHLLDGYKRAVAAGHLAVEGLVSAALVAESVLAEPYSRPTCDEDCDNEFCGSPRHLFQVFNESTGEWEDT